MKRYILYFIGILINVCACGQSLSPNMFMNPPCETSLHTWWHWMDGCISKDGITKDLESMKKNGISQATIVNIGKNFEKDIDYKRVKFFSPEWIEMFRWALSEADRLGLTIGITTIDGFATSGGPWIKPEDSMKKYVWSSTNISGGESVEVQLKQPLATENYYKDVFVVAYPANRREDNFRKHVLGVQINNENKTDVLYDANPYTEINLNKNDVIDFDLKSSYVADKLTILPHLPFCWDDMGKIKVSLALSCSDDGITYKNIGCFDVVGVNKVTEISFPRIQAKYFRIKIQDTNFLYFKDYPVAEIELLESGESPMFTLPVTSFFEKVSSVFDVAENVFDKNLLDETESISSDEVIDLTSHVDVNGKLNWNAPEGNWEIIRFGYTSTGVYNDPPTMEGRGLEVDKMDTLALEHHFDSYAAQILKAAGKYKGNVLKFILQDSWEAGFQTWSKDFDKEFEKRRGYSIVHWIPALCGKTIDGAKITEAFFHDYRQTIAELIDNYYYKHYSKICKRNGVEFHAEGIYSNWGAYPPSDPLTVNKYFDVPMTEFWAEQDDNQLLKYKPLQRPKFSYAVASALAYNKRIVASEAYTGFAHYSETPFELKPFGDATYCSGVNQLILHSYVHQPFDEKPGMTLGKFGGHFNRNNPTWKYFRDWVTYHNRVQYVLQKGQEVVDVAFYVGDEFPQFLSHTYYNDIPSGYRAMAFNFEMLEKAKVVNGGVTFDGEKVFPMIFLAKSTKVNLKTLEIIAKLVSQGAVVCGVKSEEMLSLPDIKRNTNRFNELVEKLWGNQNPNSKFTVLPDDDIEKILLDCHIYPHVKTGDVKDAIMFTHRRCDNADIYYLFNQFNSSKNVSIGFKSSVQNFQIWNPVNGSISQLSAKVDGEYSVLDLCFKPYESYFIIANKWNNTDKGQIVENVDSFHVKNMDININFEPLMKDMAINAITCNQLKNLAESSNPQLKYFAGDVIYTIKFKLAESLMEGKKRLYLDLGKLSTVGNVLLNGIHLGFYWYPEPYDVSDIIKADNVLQVRVATTCRNMFIGMANHAIEGKGIWTTSPVEQILKKDMPLYPIGLIGPITIIRKW